MAFEPFPRGGSLYDYCRGVVDGLYGIKEPVKKLLEAGKFADAATWAGQLLSEWHPTRNDRTPQQVTAGSKTKVWWLGACRHEWEAVIDSRSRGHGCPFCSGQKVLDGFNDLATKHPELAAEWHPTRNDRTPQQVTVSSGKKVWWLGACGHTWEATIGNRSNGSGCRLCSQGLGVKGAIELVRQMVETGFWKAASQAERYWVLQAAGATAGGRDKLIKDIVRAPLPADATDEKNDSTLGELLTDETLDALSDPDSGITTGDDQVDDIISDPDFDSVDDTADDPELPEVNPGAVLEALDQLPGISADSETAQAIITSHVHDCWKDAFRNGASSARQHVNAADLSGALTVKIREQFLAELDAAETLPIPPDFSCEGLGFEPNLMQRHVAADILRRRRVGNWSGTGTGKTVSAVLASRTLNATHTLVLCPNSTVDGWADTIRTAVPNATVFTSLGGYTGSMPGPVYWVLNNEKLQQHNSEPRALTLLQQHPIDFIVIDEVHNFKVASENADAMSRRRNTLEGICATATELNENLAVLGMSATPVINNLIEAKSLISLVTGCEHDDLDTRATINNCLAAHKQLVLLGARQMPNYPIAVNDSNNIDVDLSDGDIEAIKALGRRPHPADIERVLTHARAPKIAEYLADRKAAEGPDFRPTIIYTEYKIGILPVLRSAVENVGLTVVEQHGDDHTGKDAFIAGTADVLICTSAIATGVDGLQTVCNRMIINALPWTDALYTQLKGRIVRQGSKFNEVDLIRVVTSWDSGSGEDDAIWSWDDGRYRRVQWKKGLADATVDGVIPDADHISPSATRDHLLQWLDRLTSTGEITISRPVVKVPLSDEELARATTARNLSDFSELNRRWNSTRSDNLHRELAEDPTEWNIYHTLYRQARANWTHIPARWVADQLLDTKRAQRVADLGCGERLLEEYLGDTQHDVQGFDHLAIDSHVIECDITNIGEDLAPSGSFDRVVLCLAVMAHNQADYFTEAARLLDTGGVLYMVETNAHIGDHQDDFIAMITKAGFSTPELGRYGDQFWTVTAHKR